MISSSAAAVVQIASSACICAFGWTCAGVARAHLHVNEHAFLAIAIALTEYFKGLECGGHGNALAPACGIRRHYHNNKIP